MREVLGIGLYETANSSSSVVCSGSLSDCMQCVIELIARTRLRKEEGKLCREVTLNTSVA